MRIQVISRNLGLVLLVDAIFMALSAIVSVIYRFDTGFSPLILSCIITATIGSFPFIFVKKTNDVTTREGYVIIVFAWVLSCFLGMLPFLLWGGDFSMINAWYESVSGFTTTGSTILSNVERLPRSLLFWRSCTHWIGGMGVVMFTLLVLPEAGTLRLKLSKMEASNYTRDSFKLGVKETIRSLFIIYFSLTLIETILLRIAGMRLFDSVTFSLSTIATGGFTPHSDSVMGFNSPLIEFILGFFMFIGGLHLGLLYLAFTGKPKKLFQSPVTRYYFCVVVIASIIIAINLFATGTYHSLPECLRYSFFQVISLSTTTGFASANCNSWPLFSIILFHLLCFQCACAGSTTGGLKADRIMVAFSTIKAYVIHILHPKSIMAVRVGGKSLDHDFVTSVILYITIYFIFFALGVLLYAICGMPFLDCLSSSICHLSNIGISFGEAGTAVNSYDSISVMAKLIASFQMIIGRIEILGFLILFVMLLRK